MNCQSGASDMHELLPYQELLLYQIPVFQLTMIYNEVEETGSCADHKMNIK